MANYGDVALGLPANWNRNYYNNQAEWMLYTVGHSDGVADVYKEDEPDTEHQFLWADTTARPGHTSDDRMAMQRGFRFVKKADGWVVRDETLWTWDSEGFLQHAGQKLMFRPKEKWLAEQNRRELMETDARAALDNDVAAPPSGLIPTESAPRKQRKRGI